MDANRDGVQEAVVPVKIVERVLLGVVLVGATSGCGNMLLSSLVGRRSPVHELCQGNILVAGGFVLGASVVLLAIYGWRHQQNSA
jgi:hypothetical protein